MEEIMANAVARGIGNAKNISDIVAMVQGISSKSGANVAAGSTALVGKAMTALSGILPGAENEGVRKAQALGAIEQVNARATSTAMDFPSIMQMANLSSKFSDVTAQGRLVFQRDVKMQDIQQLKELEKRAKGSDKKDAAKAKEEFEKTVQVLGIEEFYIDKKTGKKKTNTEETTSALLGIKAKTITDSMVGSSEKTIKQAQNFIESGGKTTIDAETRSAMKVPFAGQSAESLAGAAGYGEIAKKPVDKTLKDGASKIAEGRQSQAAMEQKVLDTGLGNKGTSPAEAFGNIAKDLEKALVKFNPAEMQLKAVQAADQMNLKFDASMKTFDDGVDKLLKGLEQKDISGALSELINTLKSGKSDGTVPDRGERPNPTFSLPNKPKSKAGGVNT